MIRKIFNSGWEASSSVDSCQGQAQGTEAQQELLHKQEIDIVERLAEQYGRLPLDGSSTDVGSEEGCQAVGMFLSSLELAAQQMALRAAPRNYRTTFSPNYRSLFPDWARHYRVDVLAASTEQHSAIHVNGDKFELSPEAVGHGETLQQAWAELCAMIVRWSLASADKSPVSCPTRSEVTNALVKLDYAWANFEHKYISELISIEEQARLLLVKAVSEEAELQKLEAQQAPGTAKQEAQRALVSSIAHLNSVANFRGKGRDDLKAGILDSAVAILRREAAGRGGKGTSGAAQVLAADVVESFNAARAYLQKVSKCLERVDPHLCNNAGLVAQLLDWEESWEMGARFVRDEKIYSAVSDLVAEIQSAQQVAPKLTAMVNDCDVELFMVLPRILWLCYLAEPHSPRAELLRWLLPHRFGGKAADKQHALDSELEAFVQRFRAAMASLGGRRSAWGLPPNGRPSSDAWQILVKRAVAGSSTDRPQQASGAQEEKVLEELMHELERWSIELQRHCPEDWNQCSAVLVQCLSGESQKQRAVKFQI